MGSVAARLAVCIHIEEGDKFKPAPVMR